MAQSTYASRFRYLDADDVEGEDTRFGDLDVFGTDGRKIGNLDGFVIDADARRLTYIVVDSGGWFTSRRLLLPVGHATLSADRRSLRTDVTRDALGRLPEFDESHFPRFTDDELRAFERNTVAACCPDEPLEDVSVAEWGYGSRRHYAEPAWWASNTYAPERLRPIGAAAFDPVPPRPVPAAVVSTGPARAAVPGPHQETPDRELVTARAERDRDDVSPHHDGRAQPGDVLGIETGGERTGIGDTAEDEDKRRRAGGRSER